MRSGSAVQRRGRAAEGAVAPRAEREQPRSRSCSCSCSAPVPGPAPPGLPRITVEPNQPVRASTPRTPERRGRKSRGAGAAPAAFPGALTIHVPLRRPSRAANTTRKAQLASNRSICATAVGYCIVTYTVYPC